MPPLAMGVAVPAFVFLGSSGPVVTGAHHWYPMVSAAPFGGGGLPAGPDMPHLPDPGMTYYTPMVTAGTAVATHPQGVVLGGLTSAMGLPGDPWWFGMYGPNIYGD
jgi:hypothetical protein